MARARVRDDVGHHGTRRADGAFLARPNGPIKVREPVDTHETKKGLDSCDSLSYLDMVVVETTMTISSAYRGRPLPVAYANAIQPH
jgi:hypothetical protein